VERDVEEACAQGRVGDLIRCLEQLVICRAQGFKSFRTGQGFESAVLHVMGTDERLPTPVVQFVQSQLAMP
jgi:hypothetical protein